MGFVDNLGRVAEVYMREKGKLLEAETAEQRKRTFAGHLFCRFDGGPDRGLRFIQIDNGARSQPLRYLMANAGDLQFLARALTALTAQAGDQTTNLGGADIQADDVPFEARHRR